MTLLACGINHQTAPIALRERIAFSPDRTKNALTELLHLEAVKEAMILSTCNRVEIYGTLQKADLFQTWVETNFQGVISPYWYSYREKNAVSHIMRVASGLDSMILGEPQILGQMKQAYALAQEVGSIGTQLGRLFQTVFNVSKQVRTDTKVGNNPITVGYATVVMAKRIFSDLSKRRVLLIGSGEIIELTALHLYSHGIKHFTIASRSQAKAQALADKIFGHPIVLGDIPLYLKDADIIISATASELPILGKGAVERAIKARKHRPIFMVDLAVPRDIEPEVANLEDVYLYNIDDLQSIVDDNRQYREEAAKQAESIIDFQANYYLRGIQSLEANTLIKQYREQLEHLSALELERAAQRLDQGHDPKSVLTQLTNSLLNKISHSPSTQMKKAAFDGRLELLAFARQLLDL